MIEGQKLLEASEREKRKDIETALRNREEAQRRNLEMLKANEALQEYRRVQAERDRLAEEQIAGLLPFPAWAGQVRMSRLQ